MGLRDSLSHARLEGLGEMVKHVRLAIKARIMRPALRTVREAENKPGRLVDGC